MARRGRTDSPQEGIKLLTEISRLYYLDDLTQDEIAKRVGGSRSNVSRMLREARSRGLVEIKIHTPLEPAPRLQRELKARMNLQECLVMAAEDSEATENRSRMAAFAAQYLQENVSDNGVLGVGWSRTIYSSVNSGYLSKKRGMSVVQLMGSVGGGIPELNGISTATRLADTMGADAHYLHAPMLVADSAVRDGLLRDQNIRRTMQMAGRADTVVVGIGEIGPDHGQYLTGYLNDADLDYIRDNGAVCDVCGSYFSRDGSLVPLEMNERTLAVNSEDIRRVPDRIGVSWGAHKALANVGAIRSGLINVLITDEAGAEEMLALTERDVTLDAS